MDFIPNPSLRGADPVDVLRLARSERIGPITFFHLVKFAGSVAEAIAQAPELSRRGGRRKPISIIPRAQAERELEQLEAFGAQVLLYGEAHYPRLLQFISDAPPLLSLRGHPHLLGARPMIGIVGARNASANGCAFARKLAADLAAAGYCVVSGGARGIDTHAHRGALAGGTVAVIGGGIDNVYPPENAALFEEIAASGAMLSELPFGAQPHARSFPGRNRIIAGMSRGVIVVEASLKSGSLITARFANDYGREIFSVPGSPLDSRCHGTNKLLREGATLIESAQDVLQQLPPQVSELPLAEPPADGFHENAWSAAISDLDSARTRILSALSPTPTALEDILASSETTTAQLMVVLLELELAGRLERLPGGRVALTIGVT